MGLSNRLGSDLGGPANISDLTGDLTPPNLRRIGAASTNSAFGKALADFLELLVVNAEVLLSPELFPGTALG